MFQVSFEPNPKHAGHLKKMSEGYATCGIKMIVYEAGVGHKDMVTKFAPFNTLFGSEIGFDSAGRLIQENETVESFAESHYHDGVEVEEVSVIRFAKFLTEVVATRKLPVSAQVNIPRVVIKSDIEGGELKVLNLSCNSCLFSPVHSPHPLGK